MSSNSTQALIIANAIAQSKTIQPNQTFNSSGRHSGDASIDCQFTLG